LTVKLQLPRKAKFLLSPARYKVLYGGRGSSKSWSISGALVTIAATKKKRILCCREVQRSIRESVHKLLSDQIDRLGLRKKYDITHNSIKCRATGSEFIFEGLYQNVDRIKSLEGIDICWVSEAHKVSYDSWEILLPTIRKPGSEVWVDFNPDYEDDDTYQRWVNNPPDNAEVILINYDDNPWFPEVLETERRQDEARLPKDEYENKWLGKPKGMGSKVWATFDKKWCAVFPKNQRKNWPEDYYKWIYAEWPDYDTLGGYYHEVRKKQLFHGTLLDLSKTMYSKDGIEKGFKVAERFIDTRFAKGSGSWSWSSKTEGIVSEFAKPENGGIIFKLPAEKLMDAQKEVIKRDMSWNKAAPVNQFNEPAFYAAAEPQARGGQ
jgi:phage terminase large subunit